MFYFSVDFIIPKNGIYRDLMRKQAFPWNMAKGNSSTFPSSYSGRLLRVYYMSDAILSSFHILFHTIFKPLYRQRSIIS